MPRSLRFSYDWLSIAIEGLCTLYGKRVPSADLVAETRNMLKTMNMETIFQAGLHEFLTGFITRNSRLTDAVAADYNFGRP
jgi:uncharacterized alpha-E superfamily protein